jgi:hypothetical protein
MGSLFFAGQLYTTIGKSRSIIMMCCFLAGTNFLRIFPGVIGVKIPQNLKMIDRNFWLFFMSVKNRADPDVYLERCRQ